MKNNRVVVVLLFLVHFTDEDLMYNTKKYPIDIQWNPLTLQNIKLQCKKSTNQYSLLITFALNQCREIKYRQKLIEKRFLNI